MEERWSVCLQTLEGHNGSVKSVIFSHDSKLLASASVNYTVKVSVIFSQDSKLLVSASDDETIKVWDASTGQCLQTLEGHDGLANSVIFSHDSKLLASASFDRTVNVWDASTGQCLQALDIGRVTSVKSFDITNSYLETDNGTVYSSLVADIGLTNTDSGVPRFEGYNVSPNNICITWNSEYLLWLPPKYRPYSTAVSLSTICFGCRSGRVLLFTLDSPRLLNILLGH
ncbi:katanin P80 subunit, putative [Talaromyces stipitatus ATCC 10500]|uniref:Mitochondrial division protein 1 n=1 Tax=Talaromyces stipitatus (strain ATCC 10500 / CBS 375.48 / QM 6759 / NRRL 1006) TaxID=441959 RepID=B8ME05_TALSN|nr:katanin P80 subunit, putative [Talaromyces stipitatus ATCC 10500]EED16082.1 katanin P80 subunit, putative [Talaromyces stipitatus ATCC 10500]